MLIRKILGLLAVGGLLVVAAPTPQAQAASPLAPGVTTAIQQGSAGVITDVQYRRRYHHRRYHRHHRHHYAPRVYVPRVHVPHRRYHHHHHRRW